MTNFYQPQKWSLADLFTEESGPMIEAALAAVQVQADGIEKIRPELGPDLPAGTFQTFLDMIEDLSRGAARLHGLAMLRVSADTSDQAAQSFLARMDDFMAQIQNQTLFFELWWKDLPDEVAGRLLTGAGDRRYWLEEMRRFKPHTLTESEEKIINIKATTGHGALTTLYDTITARYVFNLEVAGEKKELTRGQLMVHARDRDPQLRARAYQELYRVFGQDGPILGQIYQTLVRDWKNEELDLRHHRRPISARNLANDLPDEAVRTLLDVSRDNAEVFRRFFQLKARRLGLNQLRRYDLYAPVADVDRRLEFNEAVDLVMSSLSAFDPKVADLARRVLDDNHLDAAVRPGKRDGAFCASILPGQTPWVLMNYQGRMDDAATLAHELGHAVHALLAGGHGLFTFEASLPLAETASTFAEILLLDGVLARESDPGIKSAILFRQLDDSYATIMRQTFFALFEEEAHDMVVRQATVDELAQAYLTNLKTQFGPAVEVAPEFMWEWVSIPHIYHTPFYVYAYSFGQLLVLALYRRYQADPRGFRPRLIEILAAGGSDSPTRILARAGIDISDAAFWQGGFDLIQGMIREIDVENYLNERRNT